MTYEDRNANGSTNGVAQAPRAPEAPPSLDFALSPLDKVRVRILPVATEGAVSVLELNDYVQYEFTLRPGDYRILPGDELTIHFGADPKLEYILVVRPDGKITLANIAELTAMGKTPLELTAEIDHAYRDRLSRPAASVNVTKTNTARVELSGKVPVQADGTIVIPKLGSFPAAGIETGKLGTMLSEKASAYFGTPLLVRLTRLPAASSGIGVIGFDDKLSITADGMIALPELGLIDTTGRSVSELQTAIGQALGRRYKSPLAVFVGLETSEARVVYVDGEIGRPGMYPLAASMTLLKALAVAGGTRETADLRSVMVIRRDKANDVVVYSKNLRVISDQSVRENDIFLLPQDIVLVTKSGVAKANQWVDQYITRMLPFSRNVSYSYNQGETAISR